MVAGVRAMAWMNGIWVRAALGGLAFAAAGIARADVKAGVDAWSRGQYEVAVREWRAAADRGDADAQFNLAQAYKLGRGVPADLAKAEELFGKAAAKGHLQAADNYGLLLFQRGERQKAMPYIEQSALRGDPRAQYLLGIAHFNGDGVAKDWVRAYALVTLAQQASVPQAAPALRQMDNYIPLDQRQQSVPLASKLRDDAQATRTRHSVAADLGAIAPSSPAPAPTAKSPEIATAENAVAAAARAAGTDSPRTAGADYARPQTVPTQAARAEASKPKPKPAPAQPRPPGTSTAAIAAPSTAGAWRVQLGAFGVPANADALWNRAKNRPELAGHPKLLISAGRVTKLQAGGFASQSAAQAACSRLSSAGFACLAVRN